MKAATECDTAAASEIIARGAEPSAQSVFLGDKRVLLNRERTAFVSYGRIRCSWIAAGDPVGPPDEILPMIRTFADAAAAASAWPAFYKVTRQNIDTYLENNFLVGKVGEIARARRGISASTERVADACGEAPNKRGRVESKS